MNHFDLSLGEQHFRVIDGLPSHGVVKSLEGNPVDDLMMMLVDLCYLQMFFRCVYGNLSVPANICRTKYPPKANYHSASNMFAKERCFKTILKYPFCCFKNQFLHLPKLHLKGGCSPSFNATSQSTFASHALAWPKKCSSGGVFGRKENIHDLEDDCYDVQLLITFFNSTGSTCARLHVLMKIKPMCWTFFGTFTPFASRNLFLC